MYNNIIFVVFIILFILLLIYINNNKTLIQLYKYDIIINESDRIKAMNGFIGYKYIPFSYHHNLFNRFKILSKILKDNNIPYFITCGALIGYDRHNGGFIPWDDDIDICIDIKNRQKLLSLTNNNCYFTNTDFDTIKFTLNNPYRNDNDMFIDIFCLDTMEDGKYNYYSNIHRLFWPKEYFDSKNDVYPLIQTKFKLYFIDGTVHDEIDIYIPKEYKKYLNNAYPKYDKIYKSYDCHKELYNKLYDNFTIVKD